jgi:predicted phage baseplate assembly protein
VAIEAPNLDDRTFQDIVDEAKRLIPRYCPEWTNHNLSDPGVALIELFAWMSEMVLYRLNQVPDRLYVKFLNLVGIEPFPASVARADVTFLLSTVLDQAVVVPEGTEVATAELEGEAVIFSTTEELVISPPRLMAAKTGTAGNDQLFFDAWDDVRFEGAEVVCFTSDPITPGDAMYLGFEDSLAGNLLRLTVKATIAGTGIQPEDAPIAWESWSGESWVPARVQSDTTGGLNRNGQILLLVPPRAAQPLSLGDTRAFWLRARLLTARNGQPFYQASPRVGEVKAETLGGTVVAEHATVIGPEVLGRSDGTPGQSFAVLRAPVLPRTDGERAQVVVTGDHTRPGEQRTRPWEEVDDFTASGPEDHHYVLHSGSGTVEFGPSVRYADGSTRQHGAAPPDGAEMTITRYRHGGGGAGNVGADTLTVMRSSVAFIDRVTNFDPATGGVDPETVRNAKLRGPLTLRTGQRAVTVRDFERMTLESSSEVARVRCLAPASAGAPVRLLVVPDVRRRPDEHVLDDFALSDQLVAGIGDHLEPRRLLGTSVEICTPFYQGVTVAGLVQALPGRPHTLVRQRCLDALYRYVNPLVGGADGNGWAFDTDLNASPVSEILEAVEGVERVEELLLFPYDLRTGQRVGAGREMVHLDAQSLFLSARHQVIVR